MGKLDDLKRLGAERREQRLSPATAQAGRDVHGGSTESGIAAVTADRTESLSDANASREKTIRRDSTERRPGRPLEKDRPNSIAQTKPWIAEGMSRTTWYKRQRDAK